MRQAHLGGREKSGSVTATTVPASCRNLPQRGVCSAEFCGYALSRVRIWEGDVLILPASPSLRGCASESSQQNDALARTAWNTREPGLAQKTGSQTREEATARSSSPARFSIHPYRVLSPVTRPDKMRGGSTPPAIHSRFGTSRLVGIPPREFVSFEGKLIRATIWPPPAGAASRRATQ